MGVYLALLGFGGSLHVGHVYPAAWFQLHKSPSEDDFHENTCLVDDEVGGNATSHETNPKIMKSAPI